MKNKDLNFIFEKIKIILDTRKKETGILLTKNIFEKEKNKLSYEIDELNSSKLKEDFLFIHKNSELNDFVIFQRFYDSENKISNKTFNDFFIYLKTQFNNFDLLDQFFLKITTAQIIEKFLDFCFNLTNNEKHWKLDVFSSFLILFNSKKNKLQLKKITEESKLLISKIRIKNFNSIKDTNDICFYSNLYILVGQNQSGKSSILEALRTYSEGISERKTLNYELEISGNMIQSISCTYDVKNSFFDNFENESDKVYDFRSQKIELTKLSRNKTYFDSKILKEIKTYTVTKTFHFKNNKKIVSAQNSLDSETIELIKKASYVRFRQKFYGVEKTLPIKSDFFSTEENQKKLTDIFLKKSPSIIFFNEKSSNILPNSMTENDWKNKNKDAEGYEAMKNLEIVTGNNFLNFFEFSSRKQKSAQGINSLKITEKFKKNWTQKIHNNDFISIEWFIANIKNSIKNELIFSFLTKKNENLEFERRSAGFKYFFSIWLSLNAHKNQKSFFVLDEPGNSLHSTACKDLKLFFIELKNQGHQILFGTHLPYMINYEDLCSLLLIHNDIEHGTTAEKIMSNKFDSKEKQNLLQPIFQTMGYMPSDSLGVLTKKNIIVEGISDLFYYAGMAILLNKNNSFKFIPILGNDIKNIYPIISFCYAYDLKWFIFLDKCENIEKRKRIFNLKFIEESFQTSEFENIEQMFQTNELKILTSTNSVQKQKCSKIFFNMIKNSEITKEKINPKTIKNFENHFEIFETFFKKK